MNEITRSFLFIKEFLNMYLDGLELLEEKAKNYRNAAFFHGDVIKVHFFFKGGRIYLAEDCYFFMMSSMRKMRMDIPMDFTLEYFVGIFSQAILEKEMNSGIIDVKVFRGMDDDLLSKASVHFVYELREERELFSIKGGLEMDILKEIYLNTHFLSNIQTHFSENIYAEIYAKENGLNDLVLLNYHKRIARGIYGNLLFLEAGKIKIPKQSEGAYISPLIESFVTFVHKSHLAEIVESEILAFESQKAEEILMISDTKGIYSVKKIRNKEFSCEKYSSMVEKWAEFLENKINGKFTQ